jgi:hypothetical protein
METRYRRTGPNTYEVDAVTGNVILGTVKRFGSLPSMRHWRARRWAGRVDRGEWGPPRQTRDKARNDLLPEETR